MNNVPSHAPEWIAQFRVHVYTYSDRSMYLCVVASALIACAMRIYRARKNMLLLLQTEIFDSSRKVRVTPKRKRLP